MKIKNVALLTVISLCTIPAYGMEENNFDKSVVGRLFALSKQTIKNAAISEKRSISKSEFNKKREFLENHSKINNLTLKEKHDLLISLKQDNQLINECYSAEETWSNEDCNQFYDRKFLIEKLEQL